MKYQILLCFIAILFLSQAYATVWFELKGGSTKCFLEEVPKDTLILGKYKFSDLNAPQVYNGAPMPLGLNVKVEDQDANVVLERSLPPGEGRFAFTSQVGAEHKICFSTNSSRWFGPAVRTKLELDIDTGVGATDYEEIAKAEHLSALEVGVRRLNDRVASIRKEQNYQRAREATFRNTSESTNARVGWWAAAQVIVLVAMGLWQMKHLKSFFKAKKLV